MSLPDPKPLDGVTVAFDLDGTLVDTAPDLMGTLNLLLVEDGLPTVSTDDANRLVGRGARAMIERGFSEAGRALSEEEAPAVIARYIALYRSRIAEASRPFPGMVASLDRLEALGARFVVCTNKRTDLSIALLDALALTGRFAAVIGADAAPAPKPDPRHLLSAIAAAKGDPRRSVMVGDSFADVGAAKAAGVPVVVVSFGYTEIPPAELGGDRLIDRFDQLEAEVVALMARAPLERLA
jgi:phosphoglycolate phosphatase